MRHPVLVHTPVHRALARPILLALGLMAGSAAQAGYLVNTGDPGNSNWLAVSRSASLFAAEAASFTVDHDTTITEVAGWLRVTQAGNLSVVLYAGAPSFTATPLYAALESIALDSNGHWESFSGLDWSIQAGTYTLAFVPTLGFSGAMAQGAPNPASAYYYYTCFTRFGCNADWLPTSGNSPALGVRISEADAAVVPEPATATLTLLGLSLGLAGRRSRVASRRPISRGAGTAA